MFRQLKATEIVQQIAILESGEKAKIEAVNIENLIREIQDFMEELQQEIKA